MEIYRLLEVALVTVNDILAAIDLMRLNKISNWDALMIRSALSVGCRYLLTEDLNHGRRFDTLEIVNPFRSLPTK